MSERMVLNDDLNLEDRRLLMERASQAVERIAPRGTTHLTLDCSQVETVEGPMLGTLAVIARNARRHGIRVELDMPSVRVRQDIIRAGLRPMFDWSATTDDTQRR